ncbi:hypothetical protein BH09MYX1_BH09MYX1_42990 [soil metagenome]
MPGLPEAQHSARFDELGVLVVVAETGSLSAAAKQLGVPKIMGTRTQCYRRGQVDPS